MRVSPSRISTFQVCPKRFDYAYRKNLQAKGPTKAAFQKGNYFHELSHLYYQLVKEGAKPGSEFLLRAIQSRVQQDLSNYNDPKIVPIFSIITKTMTRFMMEQSPIIDKDITVLGVEHEIDIPITLPSGKNINLYGFVDLIYQDAQGRLRIRDHKTGEKAWSRGEAAASNQLIFYSACIWLQRREVPIAEISYINTHDYVKKAPAFETAFALPTVAYTERELRIYWHQTLQLIDEMLESQPIPHYGSHCQYCAFNTPCLLERKGIDTSPILDAQYVVVDRNAVRQYPKFSENNSITELPN